MEMDEKLISNAYKVFYSEAGGHAQAWGQMVEGLTQASALDAKTPELVYLAVLAAQGITNGIPFHTVSAKQADASRQEVISAILTGLPAVGVGVTQALPVALEAYDGN
jgi:alkylhydroperoxidase/carboxymuconolactone decarboxylase family protein YurZ